MTNPNDNVNPIYETRFGPHGVWIDYLDNGGLTKREHFAAIAMQGILASGYYGPEWSTIVEKSVRMANLLIEELNKPENHGTETHQH